MLQIGYKGLRGHSPVQKVSDAWEALKLIEVQMKGLGEEGVTKMMNCLEVCRSGFTVVESGCKVRQSWAVEGRYLTGAV